MKIIRTLLVASVSLAAFSALRADSSFGRQWISHYYENPRPADFVAAVASLSRDGYFDSNGQPAAAIGFFSTVFSQNPRQVDRWLSESSRLLSDRDQRILVVAAWKAGNSTGDREFRTLSAYNDPATRAQLQRLISAGPSSVAQTPVISEASMNFQWGAFLASGNESCITNIFAALGSNQSGLATSARFALAKNATEHPRVMQICREQLDRQPEPIRAAIQAALNEAQNQKPGA